MDRTSGTAWGNSDQSPGKQRQQIRAAVLWFGDAKLSASGVTSAETGGEMRTTDARDV